MKRTRWLHVLVISIVAVFGAFAIACGGKNDGKKDNTSFDSPAIGVYYYEVGNAEYLLSLNKDKSLALTIGDVAISGKYDVNANGALKFTVKNNEKLLDVAKYADDEVTLTYDGNIYKFLRRVDYTVTYNTGSGSNVESATVRNGKKATKPDDPTYAGHVFIGWYKDAAATVAYKFNTDVVRGDITLYAGWVEKTDRDEYTVKFDLGYGDESLYATATTVNGKVYDEITDPARENYAFKGWWTKDEESGEYAVRVDLGSYIFIQNETVYALWQGAAEDGKLDAPIVSVDVSNNMLSWNSVEGAGSYSVKVVDPDGGVWTQNVQGTSVAYANKFTKAGTYTVEVYAVSLASADKNSAVTTRKIVNKQLARVSNFSVTGDVLTYSGVENATKYLLYIECGDENHDHNPVDNGNSKVYDFSDCTMTENGIKVVVEAQADGYVSSRSEEYVIDRKLEQVSAFTYDKDTQTISWSAVQNATSYAVKVVCDDAAHVVETEVKSGTSVNIGECAAGSVKVTVVAQNTKKYISSDAAQYTVTKDELPAVTGLAVNNTTLSWESQPQVQKYIVSINGQTFDVTGKTNVDLADKFKWEVGKVYEIKVRAQLTNGGLTSWSLPYSAAYKTVTELKYGEGTVSWAPVFGIGNADYKVAVNDGAPVSVSTNKCNVTLTAKTNVIKVYIDGNDVSTAKSITVNAYKLTFDGNGGTDAAAGYYAKGDPITFPTGEDVTRRGYDLVGWYTAAEGNAAGYGDGDVYDLASDFTLYARWDGKEYTVKLNYNINGDNTDTVVTATVKYGSEFKFDLPTETKSSIYGFLGWNLDRNGDGVVITGANGVGVYAWDIAVNNTTLYAVWDTIFEFEKVETGESIYYIIRKSGSSINILNEIEIPEEFQAEGDSRAYPVLVVGGNAFSSCKNLTKVTIPSTVTTIEATAFNNCDSLQSIEITGAVPGVSRYWSDDYGVLYGIDDISERARLEYYPRGRTGDYTIADGIEYIPYEGFKSANIETLTIPSAVTYISNNAFGSNIREIYFAEPTNNDETVKTLNISSGAFKGMSGLSEITLPSRTFNFVNEDGDVVENVDFKADLFYGCKLLATVNVTANNAVYTSVDGMLCRKESNGSDITVIYVPSGYDFNDGTYVTNSKITAIGYGAFAELTNLRKVTIDVSVNLIGEHAFSGYTTTVGGRTVNVAAAHNLTEVVIKGSRGAELKIGRAAFGSDLGTDRLPSTGTTINYAACVNLYTLKLENGCNITEIGNYAFSYTQLFEIELPTSLSKIGYGAFKNCGQLNKVVIGGNDTGFSVENVLGTDQDEQLKTGVFENCTRLETVVLPKSVTQFKGGVFAGCTSLTKIEVDPENKVLQFIDGILYGKDATTGKITAIHFIPESVDIEEYTIPDGITEISAGIFGTASSSIKKLTINKYVTFIGKGAFAGTNIEEVVFKNKENAEDDGATTLTIEPGTKAAEGLFGNCKQLSKVTLPARLTTIADYMFYSCSKITSFDFTGIKVIGISAFTSSGLTGELTISRTVEEIRAQAFYSNSKITKVTFEDGRTTDLEFLTKTGVRDGIDADNKFVSVTTSNMSCAFQSCTGLTEVHLPEKLVNIGGSTFQGCSKLTTINIPTTVKSIRYTSFHSCPLNNLTFVPRPNATELYLEDGVNATGGPPSTTGMFGDCKADTVTFPAGTVRIPKYCFYKLSSGSTKSSSVRKVFIPNTVRNLVNEQGKTAVVALGDGAFSGCSNLEEVEFEADNQADLNNENYLGMSMYASTVFTGCTKLTSITLPARLSNYYNNATLTSTLGCLTSPANLSSVKIMPGSKNFSSDDKGLVYNADKTELLFCPKGKTDTVNIPYSVTKIAKDAFNGSKITGVTFAGKPAQATVADGDVSDGLIIDEKAFYQSASLASINLPERLTSIGVSAFEGCTGLITLTFNGNRLTTIGDRAFNQCFALSGAITIPASVTSIGVRAFASNTSSTAGIPGVTAVNFGADGETSQLTTIGANAFEKIGITSVYLPDSVTTLGDQVFANCENIERASVPLSVNNFNGMFLNCVNLTELMFREVEGKDAVLDKKDDGAVYSSDNTVLYYYPQSATPNKGTENEGKLIIASNITKISSMAFAYNANITEIEIPNTVIAIEDKAFYFMPSLKKVTFVADDDTTKSTSLTIGEGAFSCCNNLTEIGLPIRLKTLGKNAFDYCSNLKTLTFAEDNTQLTAIPDYAFRYTDSLGDVVLPENVTTFGVGAFQESGITSVSISSKFNTTSSGSIFANCSRLETVVFRTYTGSARSTCKTGTNMFANCTSLTSVTLPVDLKEISNTTFQNCTALQELTLPATLTTIGGNAFDGCVKLQGINRTPSDAVGTVNIPAKVSNIKTKAFLNCGKITNINLNAITVSLTLKAGAFAGTGITEIIIPQKTSTLEAVFSDIINSNPATVCDKLTTVTFASGNTSLKTIPDRMFQGISTLSNITLPKGLSGTGTNLLTINQYAFYGTNIKSIEFPKETKEIKNNAFENCKQLKTVTFEKDASGNCKFVTIGSSAFKGSGLTSISIPTSVVMNNSSVFENCVSLQTATFENGNASTGGSNSSLFRGCSALTSVTLPVSLASIDSYMFYGCTSLEQIALPGTVRKISDYAFYNCKALTSIDMSVAPITEISSYAFSKSGLTTVIASSYLQSIGNYAFDGCASLTAVTYSGASLRTIGNYAFRGCKVLQAIDLPAGVTSIGNYAYENCDAVTTVTLPKSLRTLGTNPFVYCDNLAEVVAPDYDEDETVFFTVGNGALYNGDKSVLYLFFDRAATTFTLPEETVEIAASAFYGMPLTTVVANTRIIEEGDGLLIGSNAFRDSGLTSITLGDNVSIGGYAFAECDGLTSITIPDGAEISTGAFAGDVNLANITLEGEAIYGGYAATFGENAVVTLTGVAVDGVEGLVIKANAFQNDTSLVNVVIAEGVTEIQSSAFSGASNLTNVTLPSTLKTIGNSVFMNTNLASLTLPSSLEIIGSYAFYGNSGITSLTLPSGLKSIGAQAFNGLSITSITIPNTVETIDKGVFSYTSNGVTTACENLSSIVFEAGNTKLTNLPQEAFLNLASLTSITLPDHLESIGTYFPPPGIGWTGYTFKGTSLTSISIPSTVSIIASGVFDGISTLTSVTFEKDDNGNSSLDIIDGNAFRNTGISGELRIPASVTQIGANAFYGCSIDTITFERDSENVNSLTRISAGAFYGTAITEVTIPENVTIIGTTGSSSAIGTFEACAQLATVNFESDAEGNSALQSIGNNVFKGTALTQIVIPETVTKVDAAFNDCTLLTKVTLPKDLTSMGNNLFANMTGLTEVIIPEGVTSIANNAFEGCTGITTLVLPSTINQIWHSSFKGWTDQQTICFTGMAAPRSKFEKDWARGCNANLVWNYQAQTEPVEGE